MQKQSRYHQSNEMLLRENKIIEAAKLNPNRFEPIYKKYHDQIFRYVYQRMNDKDVASDVTSQIFLKAITKLHKYQFQGVPFSSWLFRIAMSEVYQYFKDHAKQRTVNVDTNALKEITEDLTEREERELDKKKVIKLLRKMSEDDVQMIEMRYFERRSFREIGEILDITENNAKVRCFRVIKKMRKMF